MSEMAPAVSPPATREDDIHRYARHTRNAVVFMAWVVAIQVILGLIAGIIIVVHINNVNNNGGTPTVSSTCYSVGGTDLSC